MRSVESKEYTISKRDASPSHRKIDIEIFFASGRKKRPPNDLIGHACINGSRKEKERIKVVSKPQQEVSGQSIPMTISQIAEKLIKSGANEQVAKKMTESLEIGSEVSLIHGYYNGQFFGIVDRQKLPDSNLLPYKIKFAFSTS